MMADQTIVPKMMKLLTLHVPRRIEYTNYEMLDS